MKIINIERWLSKEKDRLYFLLRATETIPQNSSVYVTIQYEKKSKIVNSKRLLQEVSLNDKKIEGYLLVKDIKDDISEDVKLNATFSNISIVLEDEILAEVNTNDKIKNEIKENSIQFEMKEDVLYNALQYHSPSGNDDVFYDRFFTFYRAFPDLTNAYKYNITIKKQHYFPGIDNPTEIDQKSFNEMLADTPSDRKEQNGQVYLVKSKENDKQVAIFFANNHRSYAEYFQPNNVYATTAFERINEINLMTPSYGFKVYEHNVYNIYIYDNDIPLDIESEFFESEIENYNDNYTVKNVMTNCYHVERLDPNYIYINDIDSIGMVDIFEGLEQ